MLKLISIIFLLFSITDCLGQVSRPVNSDDKKRNNSSDTQAISSLSYCELIKSPGRYEGKLIRIKASWQFGFENTFLHDKACPERPQAWLEFVDDKQACPKSKENRDAPGKHDKGADVTVVGRLYGPGRYGHLGAYEFKFVVTCMEEIKITDSDLK